jgi:hypothetical protein
MSQVLSFMQSVNSPQLAPSAKENLKLPLVINSFRVVENMARPFKLGFYMHA